MKGGVTMVGSFRARPRGLGLAAVLGAVVIGCGADRAEWRASLEAQQAVRLVGLWSAELTRDLPVADNLPARQAAGEIALTLNEARLSAPGVSSPPVYFGTYDLDFGAIGVITGLRKDIPGIAGTLRGPDTLVLHLTVDPPREIVFVGRIQGDSVVGRWNARQPRGVDAAGDFVLRRR
jgi:hypothetical protein